MFCREQAARWVARKNEIDRHGSRLIFVGSGSVDQARAFRDTFAPGMTIVVDPLRRTFRELAFKRSLGGFLSFRLIANVFRTRRGGFRQGSVQGDPWQLGGWIVLDRDHRVLRTWKEGVAGDEPDYDAAIESLATGARA